MKIKNFAIILAISLSVIVGYTLYQSSSYKKDIGLGYSTDYGGSPIPKRVDFVKDNTQIIVNLFPFNLDRYEANSFFIENFENTLFSNGFKKNNYGMDWGGSSFFVYIFLKTNGIEILAFRKGFNAPFYEFFSETNNPDVDDLFSNIQADIDNT